MQKISDYDKRLIDHSKSPENHDNDLLDRELRISELP